MTAISSKYLKGLNNDLGISKLSNDTLTDALNINITTDLGYSSYIIENQRGNTLNFSIPNLRSKIKIQVTDVVQGLFQIQSNFPTGPVISVNITLADNITTVQELYTFLVNHPDFQGIIPEEVQVFVNQDYLVIQQFTGQVLNLASIIGIVWEAWVPLQSNLSIIGWCQIGEDLCLLTCPFSQDNEDPKGNNLTYYGQVWRIPFRPDSDEVLNALYPTLGGSAVLNPQYHLIYNGRLDFTRAQEVYREAVGRIEDSNTQNLYWTDNYNLPRVINTKNPNAQALDEGLLDWLPDANLPIPILSLITDGGSLPVGKHQVTYQYANFDGAASNYAPFSNLVDLTDSALSTSFQDYQGAEPGKNSGKSMQFTVKGLDRRYDFLKIVLISYEVPDVPKVYLVKEEPISADDITFIITGGEQFVPLTASEVVVSQVPFKTVKTFTEKKNRLYPTNVTNLKRKLNFDARTYRFDNTPECVLYKADGTFDTFLPGDLFPGGGLYELPDTHDAVNPYNDESGTVYGLFPSVGPLPNEYQFWLNNYQYKYQSDGSTIGGEGPFVSYTFGTQKYQGSNAYTIAPVSPYSYIGETVPYVNVSPNPGPDIIQAPGTGQAYNVNSNFNSIKSPYQSVIMQTHARGEVYRYGIVGFTEKGEETFVEWIGDIKVPEPRESITNEFFLSTTTADILDLQYITINFTINTSVLFAQNPDIVAFKIVAVERQENDKTRVAMGAVLAPAAESRKGTGYIDGNMGLCAEGDPTANDATAVHVLGCHGILNATSFSQSVHYNFGFKREASANTIEYGRLPIFKSPNIDFLPFNTVTGYYKEIQWYKTIDDERPLSFPNDNTLFDGYVAAWGAGRKYWNRDTGSSHPNYWTSQGIYYRYFENTLPLIPDIEQVHQINAQIFLTLDSYVPSSFSSYLVGDYVHYTKWQRMDPMPGFSEKPSVAGVGTKCLFAEVQNPFNILGNDPTYDINNTPGLENPYRRIVSYCKYNFGQYGGPWRSARYQNTYITKSTTVTKQEAQTPLQAIVTPGDVYTVNYDCVLSSFHWSDIASVDSNPYAENKGFAPQWLKIPVQLQTSLIFPTESDVNTEMRTGKHWAKDQNTTVDGEEFARFLFDEFFYNPVYQQPNNLKVFISEPFNANFQEEQPYTTYVSKRKFDNETVDSWRIYPVNDFISLEGTFGPSNKIINFTDRLIVLQDRAVAQISSEEVGTVQDQTGAVIKTGTGAILSRYDYLTRDSGTLHQHSVVTSPFGVHYFDVRLKKYMKLTPEGNYAVSDVKGLSAFFREQLKGDILSKDKVLLGIGIHGVFDVVYNRVYMTFQDKYYPIESYSPNGQPTYATNPLINKFTIGYNETLAAGEGSSGAFESFYSFTPQLYISLGRRLYSALPDANNKVYTHNTGRFGQYYESLYPSYIEFIVNADPTSNLTFKTDFLQFWTQVFDTSGNDEPTDTLTSLFLSNDYQSTQTSLDPVTSHLKRFERSWRVNWLRDYNSNNRIKPYLRDKYLRIKAEYDNTSGNWFRLHDFSTFVTPSYPYNQ